MNDNEFREYDRASEQSGQVYSAPAVDLSDQSNRRIFEQQRLEQKGTEQFPGAGDLLENFSSKAAQEQGISVTGDKPNPSREGKAGEKSPQESQTEELNGIVTNLGSRDFFVRQKASEDLEKYLEKDPAAGLRQLAKTVENGVSDVEVKRRLDQAIAPYVRAQERNTAEHIFRALTTGGDKSNPLFVSDADLKDVAEFRQLKPEEAEGRKAMLESLRSVLRSISGAESPVVENFEQQISELNNLKNVQDKFDAITSLKFTDADITDRGIEHLKTFGNLRELKLIGTGVTADGMRGLEALTNLKTLTISGMSVNDTMLEQLKKFKTIEHLSLWDGALTKDGLKNLKDLPNLKTLNLSNSNINDETLKAIEELRQLESLNLSGTDVKGEGLKHLRGLPNLKAIDLSGSSISDDGLKELEAFRNLESIDLSYSTVSRDAVARLQKTLPNTTVINLRK